MAPWSCWSVELLRAWIQTINLLLLLESPLSGSPLVQLQRINTLGVLFHFLFPAAHDPPITPISRSLSPSTYLINDPVLLSFPLHCCFSFMACVLEHFRFFLLSDIPFHKQNNTKNLQGGLCDWSSTYFSRGECPVD